MIDELLDGLIDWLIRCFTAQPPPAVGTSPTSLALHPYSVGRLGKITAQLGAQFLLVLGGFLFDLLSAILVHAACIDFGSDLLFS